MTVIHTWKIACVKESVWTRNMGLCESHSHPFHVDIQVGTYMIHLNICWVVWFPLHVDLGGE